MIESRFFAAAALAVTLSNCRGIATSPSLTIDPSASGQGHSPIKHVVFIVQENRSFNNLFMGFPGATTQRYGYDTHGKKITLKPIDLATSWDIAHSSTAFFAACDGSGKLPGTDCKMDGWNDEVAAPNPPPNFAYAYVPKHEIAPYWAMAHQYVLADNTFASNLDGSFVAHQYTVAGYAAHTVDYPYNQWGCEGGKNNTIATLTKKRTYGPKVPVCFEFPTVASEADAGGVSWRFYAGAIDGDGGLWSTFQAERSIYEGSEWSTDVISPPAQFLADIADGTLANITWISPTYATSDHPGLLAKEGPAWVASVVDAIGQSQFWDSTAIFVFWDDWGGWFDPVKPVYADYDGLGFRVPLLMISPYAKEGYVTHVQYETSSVVRYIEDNFGLAQLHASDARASDPAGDAFDYHQKPRKFKTIPGARTSSYWLHVERNASMPKRTDGILGDD